MGETEISWTHKPGTVGRTWNPVQGCRRISPGCEHCYAERLAARFAENGWSQGLINLKTKRWNGVARLADHKLAEPLRWRKPSTVFVNSMSDLFYDGFSNEQIAAVFGVMAACPQHTFQVLTKRARRMREWFEWATAEGDGFDSLRFGPSALLTCAWEAVSGDYFPEDADPFGALPSAERFGEAWPLPNVWLGVSVENQAAADERIPELLRTPAAIRFLSCEPLIGPVDLDAIQIPGERAGLRFSALRQHHDDRFGSSDVTLDWVIAGCESGDNARPCDVAWLRSLRDQCGGAGVAYFLKQAVPPSPVQWMSPDEHGTRRNVVDLRDGSRRKPGGVIELPYLDGVQHAALPVSETTKEAPMRAAANAAASTTGNG